MALFEQEYLNLEEENSNLHQDEFDNFEDDEALKDLKIDIPQKSRVYSYYGCSQSEEDWENNNPCDFDVDFYDLENALTEEYKYMSVKTLLCVECVNKNLDDMIDRIKASCQSKNIESIQDEDLKALIQDLSENEMTAFDMKTASESFYVGRLRYCYNEKLQKSRGFALEASVSYGNGIVVPLDLSLFKNNDANGNVENSTVKQANGYSEEDVAQPKEFSIFPGQIVVLRGQNFSGTQIRVSKFYSLSDLIVPSFPNKCSKLLSSNIPFHIVCASGPFVQLEDPNQDFSCTKYIRELANYILNYRPNVVFICGPFYDIQYFDNIMKWSTKLISSENNTFPYQWNIEKLFHHQMRAFSKVLSGRNLGTKVCFIPSPNELKHTYIYPTFPEFLQNNIRCFSSPAFLNIDDITVGLNTVDSLLHMSRFEISNIRNPNSDRLKRLCSHILDHKHFYPIYPPDKSVNLETANYDKLEMPVNPHILIMPSVLRPFAFEVNKTVVINPGRACMNRIVRIKIDPVNPTTYSGTLADYTNVEIIKLIK